MQLFISYQTWTREDLEIGEASESGFKIEDSECETVEEMIDEVKAIIGFNSGFEPSTSGEPDSHTFWSTMDEVNLCTGEQESLSVHVDGASPEQLRAIHAALTR